MSDARFSALAPCCSLRSMSGTRRLTPAHVESSEGADRRAKAARYREAGVQRVLGRRANEGLCAGLQGLNSNALLEDHCEMVMTGMGPHRWRCPF